MMPFVPVVSGFGEAADAWANGLNDLAATLKTLCPKWNIQRRAHDTKDLIASAFSHAWRNTIYGHSFGACTAIKTARALGNFRFNLVLYDPVWWEPGQPLVQRKVPTFDIPANVDRVLCFLRDGSGFPFHCRIADDFLGIMDAEETPQPRFQNIIIPGSDHNSLITDGECRSRSALLTRVEYRRWLAAQSSPQ